jgi:hypothetical protein
MDCGGHVLAHTRTWGMRGVAGAFICADAGCLEEWSVCCGTLACYLSGSQRACLRACTSTVLRATGGRCGLWPFGGRIHRMADGGAARVCGAARLGAARRTVDGRCMRHACRLRMAHEYGQRAAARYRLPGDFLPASGCAFCASYCARMVGGCHSWRVGYCGGATGAPWLLEGGGGGCFLVFALLFCVLAWWLLSHHLMCRCHHRHHHDHTPHTRARRTHT